MGRHQSAKGLGIEAIAQHEGRGTTSRESPVWRYPFNVRFRDACAPHFLLHFRLRPAHAERLCLSEGVVQQQPMHLLVISHRLSHGHEVHRVHLRALVEQLVERVLTIGAGLTPHHRVRRPAHRLTISAHRLSIGLHFRLL